MYNYYTYFTILISNKGVVVGLICKKLTYEEYANICNKCVFKLDNYVFGDDIF